MTERQRQKPAATDLPVISRDSMLTVNELAKALRCSVRTIERADLPTIYIGPRTRRYLWGQVVDTLATRAA